MLMKMYHTAFFTSLIMGTTVACSANSWVACWLGLEINLMSLIPLLITKLSPLSTETAIKYFLAQAMASLMIIFSTLSNSIMSYSNLVETKSEIILMALSIKSGMAPFHFWFPQVMKIADWPQCAMIITWQKIAPFVLMSSCFSMIIVYTMIMCSAIVGSLGGLNQMNLKNILTYSSIAHSAWMLAVCFNSSIISWSVYFLIYSTITIGVILIVYKTHTVSISQIISSKWNYSMKINFMVSIMSLGGLPPFLGFIAKLSAIQFIFSSTSILILTILISSSLLSLFYYTRMTYVMILKTSKSMIIKDMGGTQSPSTMMTILTLGNIMAPTLVLLI